MMSLRNVVKAEVVETRDMTACPFMHIPPHHSSNHSTHRSACQVTLRCIHRALSRIKLKLEKSRAPITDVNV